MRQHSRRRILASLGLGAVTAIAGCNGSDSPGTESGTPTGTGTPQRATPSAPQGNATVAASSLVTSATSVNSLTSPVRASVAGQQFETLTVEYDEGFDLSDVEGESATIYVGEELGTAVTATVQDVTVSDDGNTVTFSLDQSITLSERQQIIVEYGGVRMPGQPGEYAVTVTLNDTASETGTITVENTAGEITSTFERTIEGWRVQGDAQGSSSFPNHPDSGGNPGRCLEAVDDVEGGTWYWAAPAQFTGEKSDYSGGQLTFDIYQNNRSNQFSNSDVILEGPDTTLVYDFGGTDSHPETDWTSYSVPLDATDGWTVGTLEGEAATESQFESVLGDVQQLAIRGEYVSGADTGYLDNPTLVPPGESESDAGDSEASETESGRLTGSVADEDGNALGGLTVEIVDGSGAVVRTVETNESGDFGPVTVEPGDYTAQVPSYDPSAVYANTVELENNESHVINVTVVKTETDDSDS